MSKMLLFHFNDRISAFKQYYTVLYYYYITVPTQYKEALLLTELHNECDEGKPGAAW